MAMQRSGLLVGGGVGVWSDVVTLGSRVKGTLKWTAKMYILTGENAFVSSKFFCKLQNAFVSSKMLL